LTPIKTTCGNGFHPEVDQGGILSGVNLEMYDVGSFKEGKYILQLNLSDKRNRVKWNFLNAYGAAQEENKYEFLAEMAEMISKCN
jgi:hypothetical protein